MGNVPVRRVMMTVVMIMGVIVGMGMVVIMVMAAPGLGFRPKFGMVVMDCHLAVRQAFIELRHQVIVSHSFAHGFLDAGNKGIDHMGLVRQIISEPE